MQTVTSADGTEIAYERHGDGRPLVLLHGGGTRHYWEPLLPQFTEEFAVYTPDRRGRGSSGDHEAYAIEREVEDARAVIEAVDGDPVVFGHSFGGLQAIEAAREATVEAVVAYEPAYLVGEYRERADLAARMQECLDEGRPREAMKRHLREVMYTGDPGGFEAWLDRWEGWPDCVENVQNTVRMDRALEDHRLADDLQVGAPTLLLTGSEGPAHLRESVRAVHETLPESRLVEFEGLGHGGPTRAPERIATEIEAFLEAPHPTN